MSDRSEPHNPPKPTPVRPVELDRAPSEVGEAGEVGAAGEAVEEGVRPPRAESRRSSAAPIRPADATVPIAEPAEPARGPVPPAAAPDRRAVDDEAVPCSSCGYDLRGRPGGAVCPECGTRSPRRVRRIRSTADGAPTSGVREDAASGWRGLAVASLAPIGLLTPIPGSLSLGVPIAVALGFAPVFRLHAIGRVRTLPDAVIAPFRREFARMRHIQIVELVFVGAIVLYGAAGTFASVPASLLPLYRALILAWWLVAIEGVGLQLRFGDAFARSLVDPSVLPSIARPARAVRAAQALLLVGAALIAVVTYGSAGGTFSGGAALGNGVWLFALLCIVAAAVTGGYACLLAYGHADLVAECVFEAEALRPKVSSRVANDLRLNEFKPPPPMAPPPPRADGRPHWDDDDPLPLA